MNNIKKFYTIADFNQFHDEAFIDNAYWSILKRKPDIEGKAFLLDQLRRGQKTKTQILCDLRFSKEGREKNVTILGIRKRQLANIILKTPILGYIAISLRGLFTFPALIRRLNEYEADVNRRMQETNTKIDQATTKTNQVLEETSSHIAQTVAFIDKNFALTSEAIQEAANAVDAHNKDIKVIYQSLITKADKEDLGSKADRADLDSKADKEELNTKLETLKTLLITDLNAKADKDTLNTLEEKLIIKNIPNHLEIDSDNFLSIAIETFHHPQAVFNKMDQDELYYSLFENVFYDHKVVKEKQKVYLDFIPQHSSLNLKHLDVGCGRGEFLTNLKESDYEAVGIDINTIEIRQLTEKGFDVENIDLIKYLEQTSREFSSISALQVIEHLDYPTLKNFIKLSYSKISEGGVLILETINPHNELAFNSFYMDETHKRPLPPEMMAFLLQWIGFKNIKFLYTSPMPEEFRSNDRRKNYHDYAVIGYKI